MYSMLRGYMNVIIYNDEVDQRTKNIDEDLVQTVSYVNPNMIPKTLIKINYYKKIQGYNVMLPLNIYFCLKDYIKQQFKRNTRDLIKSKLIRHSKKK